MESGIIKEEKSKLYEKLISIVFIIVLLYVAYFFLNKSPCDTPVTYSIGQVDSEFGISKSDVEKYANDASDLWNSVENKYLLKEATSSNITINFIFDERQRATIQAQKLKAQIDEQKNNLDSLKSDIANLKSEYDSKKTALDIAEASYNSKLDKYNSDVIYWNNKGGAPKNIYTDMMNQKAEIDAEYNSLNISVNELQRLANQINTLGDTHNNIVSQVNNNVTVINQNVGTEFEEGVYNPNNKTITIYEFTDTSSLKRVLAHEMGHALGLGHVDNKNSIMYYLNNVNTFKLSTEDKTALDKVCESSVLTKLLK